ncbi:MAG: FkbM family methyltransferase [Gammaproteobacteria bacterium]|nr:FkbM family methyltransferase [Gammaproteobacteria bacterium]
MKHFMRRSVLEFIQRTPFETIIKDALMLFSSGKGAKYDRQTFRVMARHLGEDSNCIDVGAYRGDIARHILRYSPHGEIYAIEPVKQNCEFLQEKFPSLTVYCAALSDQDGEATFFHVRGRPARSGLRKQAYPDPNEQVDEVKVPVKTLDGLIPTDTPIDFIKIDVEGAELNVLRGGQRLIEKWHPLIVLEHDEEASMKFDATSEELRAFLVEECGMRISTMERWLQGQKPFDKDTFHAARLEQQDFYFIAY